MQLKHFQESDSDIGPILKWKTEGERPSWKELERYSPATRHYWHLWDSLQIKDGVLFKEFLKRDGSGHHFQFMTPSKMKDEVLSQLHNSITSGHLGQKKTKEKLAQRFFWFEMKEDISIWISKCDVCEAIKPPVKHARAPLGSMLTGGPLDRLATDILGPLPVTPRDNRYILAISDHFTKWVEIFPIPDQTAATCAYFILNEVICRYGCPLSLHSDQGRNFESEIFTELCSLLEIRKTRTSVRNIKGNGQIERFNRVLLAMIKSYLCGEQTDWDLNLGCLARTYRSTPNESTGLTPNLLMLGREIRLPLEVTLGTSQCVSNELLTPGEFVHNSNGRLEKAHTVARKHLATMPKDMSTYNHDINKAVRRSTVCLRCPEETPYQGPRYRVVTHILMNHVEITQVPFYCLLCGYKTTKESQLKAHINFHRKHCEQKAEAIAAQTFEGDTFYFRKSENPYQPKPDKDFRLMGNSTKGTLREPISCSSGDSTSSLELTTIKTYVPTYGPPDSDTELASSESSSVLPPMRFGHLSSPEYIAEESPMEVVQEVLEQVSTRLLTDSDLDSSFSFLRSPPASPLVSTPSLATPIREIILKDSQDDEDILKQLLPATALQEVDFKHPACEWDHVPLRQSSKSVSKKSSSSSSSSSSTCHHLENLQNIITSNNCSLTIEVGKVQDQLRNLTDLMTTMSSQVQGLRSVVRQQGEEIRALKRDCRCQDSFTRFGRRRPYSRSYSRSQRPQTSMKK
ncbi:unnamed protein product [Mytilus coruscus]|uniref:Integrase catalytic domain-containing protein n=1 Tax=Mytilus coruscus TaxID=42192 RepID=A0A6J8CHG4_MYTCO|nr:unnamed protein product [Mytilus coruscus]